MGQAWIFGYIIVHVHCIFAPEVYHSAPNYSLLFPRHNSKHPQRRIQIVMAKSFRELTGAPALTASPKDSTLVIIDAQNEYVDQFFSC